MIKTLVFSFLFTTCSTAAIADLAIANKGVTVVSNKFSDVQTTVKFTTHELKSSKPVNEKLNLSSSCTQGRVVCSPVDNIEIMVNGKTLSISRSLFADLADVNKANVKVEDKQYVLVFDCGDGAYGLNVKIYFDAESVKKRLLYDGVTHDLMEETIYHTNDSGVF